MKEPKPKQTPEEKAEAARNALRARWKDKRQPDVYALELIRDACSEGATVGNICAVLDIGRDKFYRWMDKYPEFASAVKEGRSIEHDRLCNKLVEMALMGNVPSLIFALKARHNYVDSGVGAATLVENKVSINFTLPGAMKPEDYMKSLTATAEIVTPDVVTRALAKPGVKGAVIKQLAGEIGNEK